MENHRLTSDWLRCPKCLRKSRVDDLHDPLDEGISIASLEQRIIPDDERTLAGSLSDPPAFDCGHAHELSLQIKALRKLKRIVSNFEPIVARKDWHRQLAATDHEGKARKLLSCLQPHLDLVTFIKPSISFDEELVRQNMLPARSVKHIFKVLLTHLVNSKNDGRSPRDDTNIGATYALTKISHAVDFSCTDVFHKRHRMRLAADGNFEAFVALSHHNQDLGLFKYFLHALRHNQTTFADQLLKKDDWPRNRQLVISGPSKAFRLRQAYARILRCAQSGSEEFKTARWIMTEHKSVASISRSAYVMRAFAVKDSEAIIKGYSGSSALTRRRRSAREAEYLRQAFLTRDFAVLKHVLSKSVVLSRRTMARIKATMIEICAFVGIEKSEFLDMMELWQNKVNGFKVHGSPRLRHVDVKVGKPMKSRRKREAWGRAGEAFARTVNDEALHLTQAELAKHSATSTGG